MGNNWIGKKVLNLTGNRVQVLNCQIYHATVYYFDQLKRKSYTPCYITAINTVHYFDQLKTKLYTPCYTTAINTDRQVKNRSSYVEKFIDTYILEKKCQLLFLFMSVKI